MKHKFVAKTLEIVSGGNRKLVDQCVLLSLVHFFLGFHCK